MNWFNGSIPDAIAEVKNCQKVLLVFVVGEDELSNNMTVTYDDPAVSNKLNTQNCVALKLVVNSVPYQQFSQIYPVVVIPSSFFIGKNGLPIEIITGHLEPKDFIEKIEKIFQLNEESNGPKSSNAAESCTSSQNVTAAQEVEPMDSSDCPPPAAEGASDASSQPSTSKAEAVVSSSSSEMAMKAEPDSSEADADSEDVSLEDKVQRAKSLIETRRQNKAQEEKEKEKEEELKRREIGKALLHAKQTREEAEMKQWAENRAKEKEEERVARERVRAQIAQDRAERAAKYQQVKAEELAVQKEQQMARMKEEQEKADREAAMRSTMARLQFRLPDGSSFTHQFDADSKLDEARDYILDEIRPSFSSFTLCTTFPRRHFTESDYSQSLRDLQLAPSAAILILPGATQAVAISNNEGSFFGNMFWMLVSPLLAVWRAIASVFRRGSSQHSENDQASATPSEPGQSAGRSPSPSPSPPPAPSSSSSKKGAYQSDGPVADGPAPEVRRRDPQKVYREGNVFRINNRPADDEDNNTWNGNSTQQM